MPKPTRLSLHVFPAGSIRSAEDAARVLERLGHLLDAYAVLADLAMPPPALQALDASELLQALADYVREPRRITWTSDLAGSGAALVQAIVRAAECMAREEEAVVGLYAKTLRILVADLPEAWRCLDQGGDHGPSQRSDHPTR